MIEILLSIASSGIWSKVWTVAVAILFFGVIIMIHECGHFLFAKLFKILLASEKRVDFHIIGRVVSVVGMSLEYGI